MQVTKTVEETRKQIKAWKKEGKTIGLVPTMGFLHEGHASLIKKCREQNDIVVVSDFVNPTQFGPTEDLEAYPRDFERDSKLCESLGTDLIFCPEPSEMYHDPHAFVSIDTLSETLCGKTRPTDPPQWLVKLYDFQIPPSVSRPVHPDLHGNTFRHFLYVRDNADLAPLRTQALQGIHSDPQRLRIQRAEALIDKQALYLHPVRGERGQA